MIKKNEKEQLNFSLAINFYMIIFMLLYIEIKFFPPEQCIMILYYIFLIPYG